MNNHEIVSLAANIAVLAETIIKTENKTIYDPIKNILIEFPRIRQKTREIFSFDNSKDLDKLDKWIHSS